MLSTTKLTELYNQPVMDIMPFYFHDFSLCYKMSVCCTIVIMMCMLVLHVASCNVIAYCLQ